MERPVKFGSSYQVTSAFLCVDGIKWTNRRSRQAVSTVDHADIRGSAEAAVMVMIRRELPLTRLVGLATITTAEDSPSPRPARPLTRPLDSVLRFGPLSLSRRRKLVFDLGANRPDKADELPGERRHDLARRFALVRQQPVSAMQALLGSPGNGGHFRGKRLLQPLLTQTEVWPMTVVPG